MAMSHPFRALAWRGFCTTVLLGLASAPAAAQQEASPAAPQLQRPEAAAEGALRPQPASAYDTDRGLMLQDQDGDGFPDLTESLFGTSPLAAEDYPGAAERGEERERATAGVPAATCRPGYRQARNLCISQFAPSARTYADAVRYCQDERARLASYTDLYYLYLSTNMDSGYNPDGMWLGDMAGDDNALCGNRAITFDNDPDIFNFDGTCWRSDRRGFWCAHDLAPPP